MGKAFLGLLALPVHLLQLALFSLSFNDGESDSEFHEVSIPPVSHSALPCWKDAWMGGWVVELGNKGTSILLLTFFYPLT